ncbi:hypothetical protein HY605_03920 [Candidatus Peregrinibacteria bacterium]|nr:hypothetical protein [Candidatus Peregrinibacteria bacterium]
MNDRTMRLAIDATTSQIGIDEKQYDLWYLYPSYSEEMYQFFSIISWRLRKYFFIDGFDYWDLLSYFLFPHDNRFQKAPGLATIFNYLKILDSCEAQKLELEIKDYFPHTFKQCAMLVSQKKNMHVTVLHERYVRPFPSILYNQKEVIKRFIKFRLMTRYLLGLTRKIKTKKYTTSAHILFLSNLRYMAKDGTNLLFYHLEKELQRQNCSYQHVYYDPLDELVSLSSFSREILREGIYIGDYYSQDHFRKCEKDFTKLRDRWQSLLNNPEFKKCFSYQGFPLFSLIRPRLDLIFHAMSYLACDAKEITKRIANKTDYQVLFIDSEENMYGRAFILNKRNDLKEPNRKIVALSHELIYPGCAHTHVKERKVRHKKSPLWRPLPDIKCVWSSFAKKVLVHSCNYPPSIVKITGNPKFDHLFLTKFSLADLCQKYGLDCEKKKLLIACDGIQPPSVLFWYQLYKEIADRCSFIQVLVKPHPYENMAVFHKFFASRPPNLKILNPTDNTYELLAVADFVAVRTSTVGVEAILLGKFLFILNPHHERIGGLLSYHRNAAIEVATPEEVYQAMIKLKGKSFKAQIRKRMQRFATIFHYGKDGRASKRVVEAALNPSFFA